MTVQILFHLEHFIPIDGGDVGSAHKSDEYMCSRRSME